MSYAVTGLNPIVGAQHLGHYVGIFQLMEKLRGKHQCVLLIDDVLGQLLFPIEIPKLRNRTLFIASEYLRLGFGPPDILLVRSSRLPELFGAIGVISNAVERDGVEQLYRASLAGRLLPSQRADFGLDLLPTLAEFSYPPLVIPALTIALSADAIYGGIEVTGYFNTTKRLVRRMNQIRVAKLPSVRLISAKFPSLPGLDGNHMTNRNALYLSDDPATVIKKLKTVSERHILETYRRAIGGELPVPASDLPQFLGERWKSKFGALQSRGFSADNVEEILTKSEDEVASKLRNFLIDRWQ